VSTRYKKTPNVFLRDNCTGDNPIQVTKNENISEGGVTIVSSQNSPVFQPNGKQLAFSQAEIGLLLFIPVPLGFGTTFWDISDSAPKSAGLLSMNYKGNNEADFIPSSFTWNKGGDKFAVIAAVINKPDNENSSNIFPKEIRVGSDTSNVKDVEFKRVVANNDENTLDFGKVAWIDDNTLVYTRKKVDEEKWDIYVTSIDGNGPSGKLIAEENANETDPAPSQDGKKLAYVRGGQIYSCDLGVTTFTFPERCPNSDVFDFKMCNVERKLMTCSNEHRLTADYTNSGPCFSNDGKYIYFTSDHPHDGGKTDLEIWRMTSDGADLTDVSNNDAKDDNVACSPGLTLSFDRSMRAKVPLGDF
jgi:Tol biopolymer transport system component